jgi:cyclophilin family peptidyl-prolyl cis-trans isomerase
MVSINTGLGDIKVRLYDGTPIHRDNFIKLINSGLYNGVIFHRVINEFMIQAGNIEINSGSESSLPDSINTYTLPSEFNKQYFHKKGALAAARQGNDINPEMRSSGTQFYIVQGLKYTDNELDQAELQINNMIKQTIFKKYIVQTLDSVRSSGTIATDSKIQELASVKMFQYLTNNNDFKFSEEQRNIYKSVGGTPRLDGTYTVFGEVIEGLDVLDKIASVETDKNDRPINDIEIIKMKISRK